MDESIELYYNKGNSDKIYNVQLFQSIGGLWDVNFQYGRRGTSLVSDQKIEKSSYLMAKKVYDKIVSEKINKGYEIGFNTQTNRAAIEPIKPVLPTKTDFIPQLLNSVTYEQAMKLIEDNDWFMQWKMDGQRRGATSVTNSTIGMNRKGLQVSLSNDSILELNTIAGDGKLVIDSESIGDKLYLFDLVTVKQLLGLFKLLKRTIEA